MKILHAYPHDDALLTRYVGELSSATEGMVDIKTATCAKDVSELCREWQPNIVHVHGAMTCQLPKHIRKVVTPHGADVSVKAYVIIARSLMEKQRLQKAGHQRIEIVRNPIITRTTTIQAMARQMMDIYQRVNDSNVRELMDEPTLSMLAILMKTGITGDKRWITQPLPSQEEVNWRQLCIYAQLEGTAPILQRGVAALGISPPLIDASSIKTYLPDNYLSMSPLQTDEIAVMVNTINNELSENCLPLCRITQIHQALMRPTLDEEKLLSLLDKDKTLLLSRLLWVASQETLLDEGFMPLPPINDRKTKQIHLLLLLHQRRWQGSRLVQLPV